MVTAAAHFAQHSTVCKAVSLLISCDAQVLDSRKTEGLGVLLAQENCFTFLCLHWYHSGSIALPTSFTR